ncbi:JAB1/Mov34/MPN/PAD-1 ubiquitin protease [Carpediemonas membranifera]|uniref:JAB1/Mov34/MPN/PAD-1 ubiquitin protease n=1 Tax=Carpediemonas membranifera TaxID=201153 RepID=A0A8J6BZN0_9EUKA|nr:JAB1/Mov34/MPN/PAD-1 ubiquitin protease [Carpediemonas membranifera]|eukprot:KAG9395691.1 JAB1/Mov34/MPN/PAD-1 ubiquitin protease [Carpediemonas membranifera]
MFGGFGAQNSNQPPPDSGETMVISSLALLKMLKHGRAGVPIEVMGLMLGEFVDDYTIHVVDVFAMPQTGTGVSVEAVDEVFQTKMLEALKQVGRKESVVGWYHSHPGFGCWLSGVDQQTQQMFEQLHPRAVAVVVDPIQSVRGKVVIDAFRLIPHMVMMTGADYRQTTSNRGFLTKPSIQAVVHGLNRQYYSLPVEFKKNELERQMLLNLNAESWDSVLSLGNTREDGKDTTAKLKSLINLAGVYTAHLTKEKKDAEEYAKEKAEKEAKGEETKEEEADVDMDAGPELKDTDDADERADKVKARKEAKLRQLRRTVGRLDPVRHLEEESDDLALTSVRRAVTMIMNIASM